MALEFIYRFINFVLRLPIFLPPVAHGHAANIQDIGVVSVATDAAHHRPSSLSLIGHTKLAICSA